MKKILVLMLVGLFSFTACSQTANKDVKLSSQSDSVSYAIGIDIGKNFKKQNIEITPSILKQGIEDALADTSFLTQDEMQSVMMNFQNSMREKQQAKGKISSEKNIKEAEAFFIENKAKEGVKTLENGLQYKVLKSGSGKTPKLSSRVETHYAGRLLDGTEFDSSYKGGKPISFAVTGVIKGWTEILQLMKEGDKWEVYIPSDLAYGERGSPPVIQPNAALIFVMELISVK